MFTKGIKRYLPDATNNAYEIKLISWGHFKTVLMVDGQITLLNLYCNLNLITNKQTAYEGSINNTLRLICVTSAEL